MRYGIVMVLGGFILGSLRLAGFSSSIHADEPDSKLPPGYAELLHKISLLERRVEELERQLPQSRAGDLTDSGRPYSFTRPRAADPTDGLPQVPDTGTIPEPPQHWRKGMINGRPFYIVPLSQSRSISGG